MSSCSMAPERLAPLWLVEFMNAIPRPLISATRGENFALNRTRPRRRSTQRLANGDARQHRPRTYRLISIGEGHRG